MRPPVLRAALSSAGLAAALLVLPGCPVRAPIARPPERLLPAPPPERPAQAAKPPGPPPERAAEPWKGVRADAANRGDADAAARLEGFASKYAGQPEAALALHEAARRWRAAGQPARAVGALQWLLTDFPLYPDAGAAKLDLAMAAIAAGRAADGLETLASLWPSLDARQRAPAALAAADAAAALHDGAAEVRWLVEAATLATGEARAAAVARAAEAIDGRLSFLDVAKLKESLPDDSALLPAVTMKLARVQLHLRDFPGAERSARDVAQRWPGSPWAADARALVERIGKLTFSRPDVIGLALPLSGNYKRWGEAIRQGIDLALGEGSTFKIAVRDTGGDPAGAAAAIEALAVEEGAVVVIGGVTNAEAERAAATAEELQVPFLSLSRQEGVTAAGPYVFQNMLTPSAQAKALAKLAIEKRGMKRFALLFPSIPYGTELANAFWDEVEGRGGEVRAAESYAADRTTFTPLVKAMVGKQYLDERAEYLPAVKELEKTERDAFRRRKAVEKLLEKLAPITDFDALFIPDQAKTVKLIAPALAVEDVVTQTCDKDEVARIAKTTGRPDLKPVQLLGGNGWGLDESLFDQSPGAPGRYVRCAIYVDGFFAGSARPETKKFVEAFRKRYGATATPTILEASAYDAARLAKGAIDAARTKSRQAVRDGLADTRAYRGATGDMGFNARRMPEKELFYLTVDADGVREMTAAELAAGAAPGG
jgi:ABC-type branched-subunit amino acid transport system substrate-binding protein